MNMTESDRWAAAYYFTDLGLTVPDDISDYYTLETYLQKFLVPVKILTTIVPQKSIEFGVIGKYDEGTYAYLDALPVFMSIGKFSAYMTSKFGTKCWRHCMVDIIKVLSADVEDPLARIDDAIDKVLYNYSKKLVTFDLEGADTLIYVHNLTHAPIGDYPEELVVYPDSVTAFPGKHTLYELSQKEPIQLTQDEKKVLTAAVNVPLLSRDDLLSGRCYMPIGKELGYVEVDALSPFLPPRCVIDIINIMPDSLVEKHGDEYHALAAYIAGCQPSTVEPDIFVYLEQIKEFLSSPTVQDRDVIQAKKVSEERIYIRDLLREFCEENKVNMDCTINQFLSSAAPELVVPEADSLAEYSDVEIIEEAARRFERSVDELVSPHPMVTEKEVLEYLSSATGKAYTGISDLTRGITDSDVVCYVNGKFGRSFSDLSDLVNAAAPKITDEVILNWLNDYTGYKYNSIQEVIAYKTNDVAIDAALDILKYMRSILHADTDVEERVKARTLSRIVNVIAVSHDRGDTVKVAFDRLIESIDPDRPDYVRVAKKAVDKYLGLAV